VRPATQLAIVFLAFAAGPADAHVVMGKPTISFLSTDSDLVVRARIIDPAREIPLPESSPHEVIVVAEVLESLKGGHSKERVRFVQHGHGSLEYREGEEVAVFLKRIERSRELRGSALASHIRWVSEQEANSKFVLRSNMREDFAAVVRSYAALAELSPGARAQAMHRITLKLLASPHAMLASSALRDLVMAGDVSLLGAGDLPALEAILASPTTPIGIRIGLLTELERRGLVDGPPRWAALLRNTTANDRIAAVHASAAHSSEPVTAELVRLLASQDSRLVAAAAVALGAPGNDAAVVPLERLLASNASRVRMSAIRGLGRIGTPRARQALETAATTHADSATRRRAAAEARVLDRHTRSEASGEPTTTSEP